MSASLGDPESASPSIDFDGTKKNQMRYIFLFELVKLDNLVIRATCLVVLKKLRNDGD